MVHFMSPLPGVFHYLFLFLIILNGMILVIKLPVLINRYRYASTRYAVAVVCFGSAPFMIGWLGFIPVRTPMPSTITYHSHTHIRYTYSSRTHTKTNKKKSSSVTAFVGANGSREKKIVAKNWP